jgi:hypothetical protein
LVGDLNYLGVWVAWMLLLGVLLDIPFPVRSVHAGRATVRFFAGMVAAHVLNDLRSPATTEVAPVTKKVACFFLTASLIAFVVFGGDGFEEGIAELLLLGDRLLELAVLAALFIVWVTGVR